MRDIRPRAEEKARRRVEALHTSQGEGDGRPTGKGFESERARARQALREEVSAQRGQSVQKIAAASGEKDDGRILRVAAYCRVSTDDIDQVISIELQKNNYRDMIRANPKWKYAGTYVDDGFSGTNTEHRPAFNLMMKDAMAGKIDMIITKSVSRFARNLLDCIGWVRRLKEHEPPIPVFFEQEHLNTLDNTSNIILFVLAMVAEEESHMKSEAMLLSLEWRFSRGRFLTPALLGYDRVEVPDGHGGLGEDVQPDDGGVHLGSGKERTPRHVEKNLRLAVVPDGGADGARFPAAGPGADPPGGLLLDHDGDGADGQPVLQQLHQDGGGDVIGEIGTDHHLHPWELVPDQLVEIHLQHVLIDDGDIGIGGQGLVQDGKQAAVDLDADHLFPVLGQLGGEDADAGADFNHPHAGGGASQLGDAGADRGVDDKILPQGFGK